MISGGICAEGCKVYFVMVFDCHTHEGVTAVGDAPATGMWDACDEAANMQALELTTDAAGQAAGGWSVGGGAGIERGAHIGVAEAVQMVLALKDRLEKGDILGGAGVETPIGVLVMLDSAGTKPQEFLGRSGIVGHGQGREVMVIGGARNLREARQAGHTLGHRKPADDAFAFAFAMTADEKTVRVVDDSLDAQDEAELVVHLDPIAANAMLDAHAFDAGFFRKQRPSAVSSGGLAFPFS